MKRASRMWAAVLAAVAPFAQVAASGWSWEMPGSVYKELDFSFRAGIDRASKIFSQALQAERNNTRVTDLVPRYRAAVAEWRKVQIQAEADNFDETLIAYATFMQAYSRERAHDRNEAIKLYGEVVELHPDVDWVVIPAKYRIAECRFALGENKKGHAAIDDFVAEKENENHPLMADALNRQAWRLWNAGKWREAVEDWYRVLEPRYLKNNRDRWYNARDTLMTVCLVTGEFDRFDELVFGDVKEGDDKARYERCTWAVDRAFSSVAYGWNGYTDRCNERYPKEKERKSKLAEAKSWFMRWFDEQGALYERTGHSIDYLFTSLRVASVFEKDDKVMKYVDKVFVYLKNEKDEKALDARVDQAIDLLAGAGKKELARLLPDLKKGVLNQCWTRYRLEARFENWTGAEKHVQEYLSHKPEATKYRMAKGALADLYHHRLRELEKAIKIYQELDDPPGTLWAMEDCYRILGRKKESYQLLDEIASIFENEAPRAVWVKAQHLEQDGEKQKAIALYRRLLSQPEWKQRGESSQAHQALERLGVATGGAMTTEVR